MGKHYKLFFYIIAIWGGLGGQQITQASCEMDKFNFNSLAFSSDGGVDLNRTAWINMGDFHVRPLAASLPVEWRSHLVIDDERIAVADLAKTSQTQMVSGSILATVNVEEGEVELGRFSIGPEGSSWTRMLRFQLASRFQFAGSKECVNRRDDGRYIRKEVAELKILDVEKKQLHTIGESRRLKVYQDMQADEYSEELISKKITHTISE